MNDRRVAPFARGTLLQIPLGVVVSELERQVAGDGTRYPLLHPNSGTAERLPQLVVEREEIEGYAVAALGKLGERALDPALQGLQSDDVHVRRACASAMQFIPRKVRSPRIRMTAFELLFLALMDPDREVQGSARHAISELGELALGLLIGKPRVDEQQARQEALAAMRRVLPKAEGEGLRKQAEQALIRALEDGQLRPSAVEALLEIDGDSAREAVERVDVTR